MPELVNSPDISWTEGNDLLTAHRNITTATLLAWVESQAYQVTSVERDADGVVTSASIRWPDGSTGTLTVTEKNTEFLAVDAYRVTHSESAITITQPKMTRDQNGAITVKPALVLS